MVRAVLCYHVKSGLQVAFTWPSKLRCAPAWERGLNVRPTYSVLLGPVLALVTVSEAGSPAEEESVELGHCKRTCSY